MSKREDRAIVRSAWPGPLILAGVLGALVLLVLHVRSYWFLTDDAFIAFRYARNLNQGHGLVFNAGHEAVEGFTSLLWVLVLALFDRLGVPPEHAANVLSATATIVVWLLVLGFCVTRPHSARAPWLVLLPAYGLALNRTYAVWATGGLETRWFEAFVALGLLRLIHEAGREDRGLLVRSIAPYGFALACLTRPEGALTTLMAMLSVTWWRWQQGRLSWLRLAREWSPAFVALGATTLFRLLYFHDWVPNTWHAKVGGEFFWALGLRYLAAFGLEYALWSWIPLLSIAYLTRRAGQDLLVRSCALVLVPHLLYVAAVGGDHFEYRPLGLEVLLSFVLLHDAAIALSNSPRARAIVAAYSATILLGTTVIPWTSHRTFPPDYRTGFPGSQLQSVDGAAFLDPAGNPITRLPGLSSLATLHRDLTRDLTARLIAIRQEEHRLFLATVVAAGRELAALVDQGVLPRDLHIAVDCVGAIPYYSGLRTLDRLGLTDTRVARSARAGEYQGHWRFATMQYASERGVDLWADDRVHLICGLDSRPMLRALNSLGDGEERYVADLGHDRFLLCRLPMGLESARRRMPAIRLAALSDTTFLRDYLSRLAEALRDSLSSRPGDADFSLRLARWLGAMRDHDGAIRILEGLIAAGFRSVDVLEELAHNQAAIGKMESARITLAQAFAEAQRTGDAEFMGRWRSITGRTRADSILRPQATTPPRGP